MSKETPLVPEGEMDRLSAESQAVYDQKLKSLLEPEHNGEVVAIHLDTEDYEVAPQSSRARSLLRSRHPEGMIVTMDIGPVDPFDPLTLRMLSSQLLAEQPQK